MVHTYVADYLANQQKPTILVADYSCSKVLIQ